MTNCSHVVVSYACLNVHNIQNFVLVSGSSASSPPPTTSIAVVTCSSAICSVGLRSVGSSGAVPDHGSKQQRQHSFPWNCDKPACSATFSKLSIVLPLSSCAFNGCGSYAHLNFTLKNAEALHLYCTGRFENLREINHPKGQTVVWLSSRV